MSEPTQAEKGIGMCRIHGLHGTAKLIETQAGEIERMRGALQKIYSCGQSAEPDHWKFRCMARETAKAALHRMEGE